MVELPPPRFPTGVRVFIPSTQPPVKEEVPQLKFTFKSQATRDVYPTSKPYKNDKGHRIIVP